jgi:hypothetical protein
MPFFTKVSLHIGTSTFSPNLITGFKVCGMLGLILKLKLQVCCQGLMACLLIASLTFILPPPGAWEKAWNYLWLFSVSPYFSAVLPPLL